MMCYKTNLLPSGVAIGASVNVTVCEKCESWQLLNRQHPQYSLPVLARMGKLFGDAIKDDGDNR